MIALRNIVSVPDRITDDIFSLSSITILKSPRSPETGLSFSRAYSMIKSRIFFHTLKSAFLQILTFTYYIRFPDVQIFSSHVHAVFHKILCQYTHPFATSFYIRIWHVGSHILLYIWSTQWSDPCKGHNILDAA